jgi:hypothetical protein
MTTDLEPADQQLEKGPLIIMLGESARVLAEYFCSGRASARTRVSRKEARRDA